MFEALVSAFQLNSAALRGIVNTEYCSFLLYYKKIRQFPTPEM